MRDGQDVRPSKLDTQRGKYRHQVTEPKIGVRSQHKPTPSMHRENKIASHEALRRCFFNPCSAPKSQTRTAS